MVLGGWGLGDSQSGYTDGLATILVKYRLKEGLSLDVGLRWLNMHMEGGDTVSEYTIEDSWGPIFGLV